MTHPSVALPRRWLSDLVRVARLTRELRSIYRAPITATTARETAAQQLRTRPERFLEMVERKIFAHSGSPYLQLFRAAGCESGDIRDLVAREGLEAALGTLRAAGVYVAFDEFKGHTAAVRGSQRFRFTEADFDNPGIQAHLETRTGGSRGPGTLLNINLAFVADRALTTALAYDAHGLGDFDAAIWQISGLRPILQYTKAGKAPIAWFHPVQPLPFSTRAMVSYLSVVGRLYGQPFPRPIHRSLEDAAEMAAWLARRSVEGRLVCLTTYASSAVRVCAAAGTRGLDLSGVAFIVIGEPFTEARKKTVSASGAYAVVGYGLNEAGTLGFGCREPRASDDVHLMSHAFAMVQHRRAVTEHGPEVDAFLVTSLLTSGPKVLLNVEGGDYGVLETRRCGCRLGELGLNTHLREIRSFEKLTTEGVTFVKTELLPILEEVLPARFGGAGTDYQLMEEGQEDGVTRLVLLVHPRLGEIDEASLCRTFLDALGSEGWSERLMAGLWQGAGTLTVRRRAPMPTKAGKILPFHVPGTRG